MCSFDLAKMAETIDKLSTCLDVMLCCKDTDGGQEVLGSCEQLENLIISFDSQMSTLKEVLVKEKHARHTSFITQLEELKTIEDRCNYMIVNIPLNSNPTIAIEGHQYNQHHETKEYRENNSNNITNMSVSPVQRWNSTCSPHNGTMENATFMGQSFKSQPPKQVSKIPLLKSVDNSEMETVPKYMKGRLTALNVNVVIDSINKALENKYEILRKSRNALKKKDQDMYNTWKIQQNNVGQGQYFVTAEDITKFSETKVDKTTLNIVPILRHLKRLKESRVGSLVYYLPY